MTAWRDGVPDPDARGPLATRPIQLGDAITESLRVERGALLALDLHTDRVVRSAERSGHRWPDLRTRLDGALAPALEAARRVDVAAVRLYVFAAPDGAPAIIVTLDPFEPPTDEEYRRGVRLHVSTVPHPLNGYFGKTTSRHWAETAQRLALAAGYDGAVVCDRAGHVIESTHSTLVWRVGGTWFSTPEDAGGLPSTTLHAMERRGLRVERELVRPEALAAAEAVATVSALKLAVGVRAIGDVALADPDAAAAPLRALLLG